MKDMKPLPDLNHWNKSTFSGPSPGMGLRIVDFL